MFRPNISGVLRRRGGFDKFGQPLWLAPVSVRCAIVELTSSIKDVNRGVRQDDSNNERRDAQAIILLEKGSSPEIGDRFEIQGLTLRVSSAHKRYTIGGVLDHFECEFEAWPDAV
jgi:Mg2+/Co2+ transporter CorC